MSETTFIYALIDPRDSLVRYVGKADDPAQRLRRDHLLLRSTNKHFTNWLEAIELKPTLLVIDEVPNSCWEKYERACIAAFRNLTNIDPGGEGGTYSAEHAQSISEALTGKSKSASHRKALSRAKSGVPLSSSHKMAISRGHRWRGKQRPEQSAAMRAHYSDPAARLRTGAASKKAWSDPVRREAARQRKLGSKQSSITKGRIRVAHIINGMRRELYGDSIQ